MENKDFNKLLLLTAFSCMACDGEIAGEELSLIKELDAKEKLFGDIEIGVELKKLKEQIDKEGNLFLKRYIGELGKSELTKEQELDLLRVAYRTILADNKVEYSEVKFFKVIRSNMKKLDDEVILSGIEGIEDYFVQDDIKAGYDVLYDSYFGNVDISHLTFKV